jgi:hypothetical protein
MALLQQAELRRVERARPARDAHVHDVRIRDRAPAPVILADGDAVRVVVVDDEGQVARLEARFHRVGCGLRRRERGRERKRGEEMQ